MIDATDITCEHCGTVPELKRRDDRALSVICDCTQRSVKVKKALPEGWL